MPVVRRGELSIHWTERGEPSFNYPPVVLLHGLLLSSRMLERLAAGLGDRWVVLVDLHGHGKSSKPADSSLYTWPEMAADVIAVLDALDIDEAVIGGISLGADVTLAVAADHPDRCAGLIVEMPVLVDSEPAAHRLFGPLSQFLRVGAPAIGPFGRAVARIPLPRNPVELAIARDVLSLEPRAGSALMRGLLTSEPPDDAELAAVEAPTLVIGHRHDPLHAITDAQHVAKLMPNAELVEVSSMLHYRLKPNELAELVRDFLRRHRI